MKLNKNKDLFNKLIFDTSNDLNIASTIIEKDYYLTYFLKELVVIQPNIIFKGGTSLSKCYHLINRFSEDIDLSLAYDEKVTEGQRRKLSTNIKSIIADNNFVLKNPDSIRSRRDFNRYIVDFNSQYREEFVENNLIVETSLIVKTYPYQKMNISSYIYDYLKKNNMDTLIEQYDLKPFELYVQTLNRTLIDKVFAICDYYLKDNTEKHSRHIYDLYKLLGVVKLDDDLKNLYLQVKEDRSKNSSCLSAVDGFDVKQCLNNIIIEKTFKADFDSIYSKLIFEDVDYDTCVKALIQIKDSILFK